MPEKQTADLIKRRIDSLAQKYETKGEQLLYEQGLLIGLLTVLCLEDSKNFDIVINKLKSLK